MSRYPRDDARAAATESRLRVGFEPAPDLPDAKYAHLREGEARRLDRLKLTIAQPSGMPRAKGAPAQTWTPHVVPRSPLPPPVRAAQPPARSTMAEDERRASTIRHRWYAGAVAVVAVGMLWQERPHLVLAIVAGATILPVGSVAFGGVWLWRKFQARRKP